MEPKPLTRLETDALGSLPVPEKALYGIHTARSVRAMSFSGRRLGDCPGLVAALATVKKAAAIANGASDCIESPIKDAIVSACDRILAGELREHFVADVFAGGGSIAINQNMNEVIANVANESLGFRRGSYEPVHPKHHVNASQSTADACHSALNLAIIAAWEDLDSRLGRLFDAAQSKAAELRSVDVIARTCLQDAMVVSLGDSFSAHGSLVSRRRGELGDAVGKLKELNLGGTVVGSGEGASEEYRRTIMDVVREVSGRNVRLSENLFDAAQNIDSLAAVAGSLTLLAGSLIKVAKDLRLMASGPSAGFGEIVLPAVQEGSSFFQGKINPVLPETLIQACFLVLGAGRTVQAALEHGELNLNVFEGTAGITVLDSMSYLERALAVFNDNCFTGITATPKRSALYEETLQRLKKRAQPEPNLKS